MATKTKRRCVFAVAKTAAEAINTCKTQISKFEDSGWIVVDVIYQIMSHTADEVAVNVYMEK